ncbi:MAG: transporter substrate-binding domain-containing protein [Balneolales bacterium]|nr:transporter substrate-binding domain-containing protein [Balneolales bacterium]
MLSELQNVPFLKRSVSILMFAALLLGCSETPPFQGDSYADARNSGFAHLTVLYVPSDGFSYFDETGELTGVTVDIMHEFAEFVQASQGIEIRYTFEPKTRFSEFYSLVKNSSGGVFGLGNVTITEARKQELRFSPPYLTNIAVLITHESVPPIVELSDISETFAGMSALAFESTLHQDRIERLVENYLPGTPIEFSNSNSDIIEQVSQREDLFAYIDIYNYWRAVENGAPLRQHPPADLASERFGIIMPLDNDWGPVLSDFFERGMGFRTSRTYRGILEKHLGKELTEKLESARESVIGD